MKEPGLTFDSGLALTELRTTELEVREMEEICC